MSDEELKALFDSMRQENLALHAETHQRITDSEERTRRHMDVTAERLEKRFDFLAEGLIAVDQKLDRRCDLLDEKIDRSTTETHALIKFTYGQLDRSRRRAK